MFFFDEMDDFWLFRVEFVLILGACGMVIAAAE